MKQCWRWFGPQDPINLSDLHQVGVQGIVTALHGIPPGQVWPIDGIVQRQDMLNAAGFTWDVVESLPVSEAIKTQGPQAAEHLAAYVESLRNLAKCGVHTICYNFMPILDWTRTELRQPQPHGGTAMAFDLVDFAVFDLHLLERKEAVHDYDQATRTAADRKVRSMSVLEKQTLIRTIVSGLPGANDNWTLDDVRSLLQTYDRIDADVLRRNLTDFLSEVVPVAEALGMRLCCHPDDPPFSLLGLPRVMTSAEDYAQILNAVDSPANGATLCTGSLGVAPGFDAPSFVERFGPRIHFAHLRNTKRAQGTDTRRPNFIEAPHLEGDTDMVATVAALMRECARRKSEGRGDWQIPMRPDHGQELLFDLGGHSQPGYPLIGRMRGLAELRGIMAAHEQG